VVTSTPTLSSSLVEALRNTLKDLTDKSSDASCFIRQHAGLVLPIVHPFLFKNSAGHWNSTVEGLVQNVLNL